MKYRARPSPLNQSVFIGLRHSLLMICVVATVYIDLFLQLSKGLDRIFLDPSQDGLVFRKPLTDTIAK